LIQGFAQARSGLFGTDRVSRSVGVPKRIFSTCDPVRSRADPVARLRLDALALLGGQ
jgi:hypothetical protein